MKTFKKSLAVGISIFALMSAFGIYDYKYIALQKKHIKSCQQGNALSCQNINLYMVKRQKKKKFNVIKISETACDLGSKRACIFLDRTLIEPSSKSGRMPASIPSSK